MSQTLPPVALPGTLLGSTTKYLPGPGTHIYESYIYSSIAGAVSSTATRAPSATKPTTTSTPTASTATTATKSKPLPLLSVSRDNGAGQDTMGILGVGSGGGDTILPEVESIVLARVTRLGQRFASVEILVVSGSVCREPFQGMIRREDVRATEKDKVKIEESFRVGDLVRGTVISLGDQSNYYLSTAQNELGVVMAKSEAGNTMYPVSWKEFVDAKTGTREKRKVAKPF
ncbi:unnamed protein product [Periconia digitata]|uniref:Exosome complex component CSL4 n=1 Tax=Periconia digitata TaxID=1303443 RepID=A0A9W4URQ7_9PLEO|nr:unnamed protein product [Periconia digitata]